MPQESLLGQLYFREMFYMLSAHTKNYDKQEGNESASAPNNCLQILLLCLRVCQSYVSTIHEFLDLRLTSEVQQTNPVMLCAIVRGEVLLASAVGARPGLREGLGGGQDWLPLHRRADEAAPRDRLDSPSWSAREASHASV